MLESDKNKVSLNISQIEEISKKNSSIFVKYTNKRLNFQKKIGFLVLIPFGYSIIFIFKIIMKYKIININEIRSQFKEIIKDKKPLIICANHLTFIDSCLIIWALASNLWYQSNYKYFSWNLPAGDFFGKKYYYRIIAFLSKCIFIHRDATSTHHNEILSICQNLLTNGEIVTIFPEGKRSRSGKFDISKLTYGVGKIIQNVPDCRVLCIYIRGDKQETYSNYPLRNSHFHMSMKIFKPDSEMLGREGCSKVVNAIGKIIKDQEDEYFKLRRAGIVQDLK